MKDERKGLKATVSELQQGMKHATQTSELANPTKVEVVELQLKVEGLEGELRELKGRLHTSELFAQQLTEKSRKSEVRVRELTQWWNMTREQLQQEKRSKTRKVGKARHRAVYLKEKGILTEHARTLCQKLAGCGVPADKVNEVIHAVCSAFHINVADNISPQTVLRAVVEGGIVAHLQIVDEMIRAGGKFNPIVQMVNSLTRTLTAFTISRDRTTHKSLTYESRSIAMPVPTYGSEDDAVTYKSWFFSIDHAINHTSAEQLRGWKRKFNEAHSLWLQSPMGSRSPVTILKSVTRIRGMLTDHAADQKKLVRNIEEWRHECYFQLQGERALLSMPLVESITIIQEEND